MLLPTALLLALLHQALAQSAALSTIGDPFAAATTDLTAPTGICNDENGLLSCIPQATVCPGTIPASVSSCGCTNVRTVINCYSTFCPAQLTEDEVMQLSSFSNVLCNGIGTITLPSGVLTTSGGAAPTTAPETPAVTTSGTGKAPGTTSKATGVTAGTVTASAGTTSSTSKAAAERGFGNTVPVLGGVLGGLLAVVGLFL